MPIAAPLALVVMTLLAACGTTPTVPPTSLTTGPSIGPITAAPTVVAPTAAPPTAPSAAPPSTTSNTACTPADLKASHGLIEGAAGSRLTEVVLVAAVACSIDAFPTLGLRDANGDAVVGGVAGGTGRIDLSPDLAYASNIRVANWCLPDPSFPFSLEIRMGAEEVEVTGGSFPDEGNPPPCNGDGGPILEGGAWTPGS